MADADPARIWLASASRGQCGETVDDDRGDCASGYKGNLGMPMREASSWPTAVRSCLARCAGCARCNYISVSTKFHDCSWYYGPCCLSQKIPGFKSGAASRTALPIPSLRDRRRRRASGAANSTGRSMHPLVTTRPLRCDDAAAATADHSVRAGLASAPPAPARILLVGILSVPTNFERRAWIRHHTRALGAAPGMDAMFVFGIGCPLNNGERAFFDAERRRHPADMHMLNGTSDCITPYIFHKTLAWYASAIRLHPGYAWYAKSDDDSLIHMPRLRSDLLAALAVAAACGRSTPYAYYGPMRWRLWHPEGFGGCGAFGEAGPPDAPPPALTRDASACGAGPFPYADGSLHILTAALAAAVVEAEPAQQAARTLPALCGRESVARPPRASAAAFCRGAFWKRMWGRVT